MPVPANPFRIYEIPSVHTDICSPFIVVQRMATDWAMGLGDLPRNVRVRHPPWCNHPYDVWGLHLEPTSNGYLLYWRVTNLYYTPYAFYWCPRCHRSVLYWCPRCHQDMHAASVEQLTMLCFGCGKCQNGHPVTLPVTSCIQSQNMTWPSTTQAWSKLPLHSPYDVRGLHFEQTSNSCFVLACIPFCRSLDLFFLSESTCIN